MHITRPDFDRAADAVQIHPEQARRLWKELEFCAAATGVAPDGAVVPATAAPNTVRFDFAHLLYYFGGLIVLGSMGFFMTAAWESLGGWGIFVLASIYAGLFLLGARMFLKRPETRTPGGILVTLAVGMAPLAIYGLERGLGWWPSDDPGNYAGFHSKIKGAWIFLELGTVAVGALALWKVRFPFLTLPIAVALWYLSMDVTALTFGDHGYGSDDRRVIAIWFGVAMLLIAYVLDVRRRWQGPDYGFWLSLFGLCAFWGGLTLLWGHSEWGKLLFGFLSVGLMGVGVLLDRRAFVVFGALGVNGYLGHLAWDLFENSGLFPLVLSVFGLLIIAAGVIYQRRQQALREGMLRLVPASWMHLIPRR